MPFWEFALSLSALAFVLSACALLLAWQLRTGVPPVPLRSRERQAVIALLGQAGLGPKAVIYELGCGWGGLALALARAFPEASVVGIELSPLPWLVARLRARGEPRVRIERGDFFAADLAKADAAVCFLMMKPMEPLAAKLDRELAPETPVVAVAFWFRGRAPERKDGSVAIYRWRPSPALPFAPLRGGRSALP